MPRKRLSGVSTCTPEQRRHWQSQWHTVDELPEESTGMPSIKEEYLKILQEYLDERLYITTSTDELREELDSNCWWINGSAEQIRSLSLQEWTDYIWRLIGERRDQLVKSGVAIDLVFYCWHDEQAGQLRFNLINSNHHKLPFGAKYEFVELVAVLEPFVNDTCPGFVAWDELVEIDLATIGTEDESEEVEYIVKVFSYTITYR
jgi:hypothetical protein